MLAKEFIEIFENNMKLELAPAENNPSWNCDIKANHYRFTMLFFTREFSCFYSQGIGIKESPEFDRIFECLAQECRDVENLSSFEEFADEFGYDRDSRKAESIYHTMRNQRGDLVNTLGIVYRVFLAIREEE